MLPCFIGLAMVQGQLTPPPSLTGVKRIVMLGDSITQFGDRPGGYVWVIRETLRTLYPASQFEVFNAGISGNRSTEMTARFQKDVLDRKPDMLVVSVGVNDVWHGFFGHPKGDGPNGIPLEQYRSLVDAMVTKAQAQGARITLLAATPIGEDENGPENQKAVAFNAALRKIAKDRKTQFVDLNGSFRAILGAYRKTTGSTLNLLTTDGVHMNPQGYQVMATSILNAWGVDSKLQGEAQQAIQKRMNPVEHAIEVPPGVIISDRKAATASSAQPGYGAEQATIPYSAGGVERWCADNGDYTPNPWWQVDLGSTQSLTGVQLFFAPPEDDTWHYVVETSADGKSFQPQVDRSGNETAIHRASHTFGNPVSARYVRVRFTAPTAAQNWASLHRVIVFCQP